MGYDLRITRKADWPEPDGPEISFDEWMAVVNTGPELRIEGHVNVRLPDHSVSRRPLAAWTAYSRYDSGGNVARSNSHMAMSPQKIRTRNFAARCGALHKP